MTDITQSVFDLGMFAPAEIKTANGASASSTSWIDDPNNPTLAGIPTPLSTFRPSQNGTATATNTSTTPTLASPDQILNGAAGTLSGSLGLVTGGLGASLANGSAVTKYVIIIIGIVVIGAGLFSFDRIQQVGTHFAKGVAEGAAVA